MFNVTFLFFYELFAIDALVANNSPETLKYRKKINKTTFYIIFHIWQRQISRAWTPRTPCTRRSGPGSSPANNQMGHEENADCRHYYKPFVFFIISIKLFWNSNKNNFTNVYQLQRFFSRKLTAGTKTRLWHNWY